MVSINFIYDDCALDVDSKNFQQEAENLCKHFSNVATSRVISRSVAWETIYAHIHHGLELASTPESEYVNFENSLNVYSGHANGFDEFLAHAGFINFHWVCFCCYGEHISEDFSNLQHTKIFTTFRHFHDGPISLDQDHHQPITIINDALKQMELKPPLYFQISPINKISDPVDHQQFSRMPMIAPFTKASDTYVGGTHKSLKQQLSEFVSAHAQYGDYLIIAVNAHTARPDTGAILDGETEINATELMNILEPVLKQYHGQDYYYFFQIPPISFISCSDTCAVQIVQKERRNWHFFSLTQG
jgi:hypothetical protein